jgi:hypothetical protein
MQTSEPLVRWNRGRTTTVSFYMITAYTPTFGSTYLRDLMACLFQPTLGEVEHKNELAVRALVEAEV